VTTPVLLITFALLATLAGPLLKGRGWVDRSPRLGILVWQALTASIVVSVILASVSLALPVMPVLGGLADFLQACAMVLRAQYSTPGGAVVSMAGAVMAFVLGARVLYCLAIEVMSARRDRKEHIGSLSLVSRRDPTTDVLVVDHAVPTAYCLPGRRRDIVFTTAALRVLDEQQRQAVLRHELAHLHGHHHLVLIGANAWVRAFPRIPIFAMARVELGRLVELAADDRAAAGNDSRLTVASALVRLAEAGHAPASALAASGTATLVRVRRLAAPAAPLHRARVALTMVAATAMLALPVAVTATPALATVQAQTCPVEFPQSV